MFFRRVISVWFAAVAFCGLCVAAEPAGQLDDRTAERAVNELEFLKRLHMDGGRVIFGQLRIPDDAKVAARTNVGGDGRFCTAVAAKRDLVFMAHGYEALKVAEAAPVEDHVFDAGVLSFVRAKAEGLRTVKAALTAGGNAGESPTITCTLRVVNNAYLLEDEGHRGGEPEVDVASQKLTSGQTVSFSGLSCIPYRLAISAPTYVDQNLAIDPKQSGSIDLGAITLQRAAVLHVSYRARVRAAGGNWVGQDAVQTADVTCDGKSSLKFSDQHDKLGNAIALRLLPKGQGIEASYALYRPDNFHVLGVSKLEEPGGWDKIDTAGAKGSYTVMVEEGKVYYLNTTANSTDIQLLFQVSRR